MGQKSGRAQLAWVALAFWPGGLSRLQSEDGYIAGTVGGTGWQGSSVVM